LKIPIYQPDVKQEKSFFHSRDSRLKIFSGPMQSFAICPGDPSLLPSLLPGAAGTAHSPTARTGLASPGGDGKRKILTRIKTTG